MNILLATDGSEYSELAAKFLTRINWSSSDSITVFHAIYAVPFRDDEKFYSETLNSIKKNIAPKILDSAVAILKPVQAKLSVEIDEFEPSQCTPDQCIVRAAESSGMDLIAMGARGIKGITSVFLGSVTRLVTIHSSKPVLVIKPAEKGLHDTLKILYATDGSDHSRASAEFMGLIPFHKSTEITALHVVSSSFSDIPDRFAAEINNHVKDVVASARSLEFGESEKILERAREVLSKRFEHISVLSRVGDPSTEILKTAEAMEADIVAVGCKGIRGMKGILGSVSRNILTHAKCSVLIGKTCKD